MRGETLCQTFNVLAKPLFPGCCADFAVSTHDFTVVAAYLKHSMLPNVAEAPFRNNEASIPKARMFWVRHIRVKDDIVSV
jgi:hypothetical protein